MRGRESADEFADPDFAAESPEPEPHPLMNTPTNASNAVTVIVLAVFTATQYPMN